MPRDDRIHSVLVLGSGPIVIGQACEFDYSGTQAVKALGAEGLRVILVNSNPATVMTDPDLLDAGARRAGGPGSLNEGALEAAGPGHRTYLEPLTLRTCERILERERPDAILATVGGQTAINLAIEMEEAGILERYGVRLLGAEISALRLAEDRMRFKEAMVEIGLDVPRSRIASSVEEALSQADELGYPIVIRPSFTLGGMGSGIAGNRTELLAAVTRGLELSPVRRCLIEESLLGWKEYELEVMRDSCDQAVVICSIENLDPMGIHTGDSITVAPAMTLTDREYQRMRDEAFRVIRRIGVATGGANVQFAVEPGSRRMVVVEMNPRVSRSSALASKATGFPIAKIAAKLAVGYSLDEISNDITRKTPACFEPALDYVVVKIPRWNFEKFPGSSPLLGTQMKSVGEVMAVGRTFREALQKGMRSLEMGTSQGGEQRQRRLEALSDPELWERLTEATPERVFLLREALLRGESRGFTIESLSAAACIDPWFLRQMAEIAGAERALQGWKAETLSREVLLELKRMGFSDRRLAFLLKTDEGTVRRTRKTLRIQPVFHRIDTCAGEFESYTPYLYSTYETRCEAEPTSNRKVLILGGGPIRIGQGIEFDYCACHAAFALRDAGVESILLNCNPETVSTDYDTADRLYFEPVTLEDVLHVVEIERPDGVIIQFGGQTPLNLSRALEEEGVRILGTSSESIDLAEDRRRFGELLASLEIPRPEMAVASSLEEALDAAHRIGYPVIVRPSYVLGGRAMQVVYDDPNLHGYAERAFHLSPERPLFLDRFLEDAFEVDVDALSDGEAVLIAGIQQHIEEAGIHSGDSACVLPPFKVPAVHQATMRRYTARLARAMRVVGFLNVQFAVKEGIVYVLEANPRASRTIPWISKATGIPLVRLATRVIQGEPLPALVDPEWLEPAVEPAAGMPARMPAGETAEIPCFPEIPRLAEVPTSTGTFPQADSLPFLPAGRVFVKMPVFSSNRFPDVDTLLGPEMRSTGEVLGIGSTFGQAFAKAAAGAGLRLPTSGAAFLTVNDNDKEEVLPIARDLRGLGFRLVATRGTATFLRDRGLGVEEIYKVNEGHPNAADRIARGEIQLVINTPLGRESFYDETAIRKSALAYGIPCITTLSGSRAVVDAIRSLQSGAWEVESLQELHGAAGRPMGLLAGPRPQQEQPDRETSGGKAMDIPPAASAHP